MTWAVSRGRQRDSHAPWHNCLSLLEGGREKRPTVLAELNKPQLRLPGWILRAREPPPQQGAAVARHGWEAHTVAFMGHSPPLCRFYTHTRSSER